MSRREVLIPARFHATEPRNRLRPTVVISDPPKGCFEVLGIYVDENHKVIVEYEDEI